MTSEIHEYGQEKFDEGYYGGGARGGFKTYKYDSPEQRQQLELKYSLLSCVEPYRSILFVGCAKGFEVKYFGRKGKEAIGVDISEYAISNCEREVAGLVRLYDGANLPFMPDDSVDVVSAFDVLTLIPDAMLEKLASEMVRAASKAIVFRSIVTNYRNETAKWHGTDGVTYRMLTLGRWDQLFTQSGKFKLSRLTMDAGYECMFYFTRA